MPKLATNRNSALSKICDKNSAIVLVSRAVYVVCTISDDDDGSGCGASVLIICCRLEWDCCVINCG